MGKRLPPYKVDIPICTSVDLYMCVFLQFDTWVLYVYIYIYSCARSKYIHRYMTLFLLLSWVCVFLQAISRGCIFLYVCTALVVSNIFNSLTNPGKY